MQFVSLILIRCFVLHFTQTPGDLPLCFFCGLSSASSLAGPAVNPDLADTLPMDVDTEFWQESQPRDFDMEIQCPDPEPEVESMPALGAAALLPEDHLFAEVTWHLVRSLPVPTLKPPRMLWQLRWSHLDSWGKGSLRCSGFKTQHATSHL